MTTEAFFKQVLRRPINFSQLSPEDQWMFDKKLKLLDWDGSCPHKNERMCPKCREEYLKRKTKRYGE
jgi:hypothetical protein